MKGICKKINEVLTKESFLVHLKSGTFKNILGMQGAGISVSAGIPDFRSKTGLYANIGDILAKYNLPHPQSVVEKSYFHKNPLPYYEIRRFLYRDTYYPTPSHIFLALLSQKELLQMDFTQNIDGLELKAGIPRDKLIQAHGSLLHSACSLCQMPVDHQLMIKHMEDLVPLKCTECGAYCKPATVLFGDPMPKDFFTIYDHLDNADLIIIMGTSLQVFPFSDAATKHSSAVKVFINNEPVHNFHETDNNLFLQGECDDVVKDLVDACGWNEEFKQLWELHGDPAKLL